ncbi:hypothetical protein P7K49_022767 [Saguinus oedipus]|uniref:Uncharacterized protein n=1 Tax=Saguinus oedipus TaxID=9490 RepID=A0ABQ9UJR4_SAGOE|nr:hypothetical protein P7K49_022767 [Saguinus oedipus]
MSEDDEDCYGNRVLLELDTEDPSTSAGVHLAWCLYNCASEMFRNTACLFTETPRCLVLELSGHGIGRDTGTVHFSAE